MKALTVKRVENPAFTVNSYVVGRAGGDGVLIDAGAPAQEVTKSAALTGIRIAAVLLTHHHYDHLCELENLLDRIGNVDVLIEPGELALAQEFTSGITGTVEAGETIKVGSELKLKAIALPGHTSGMLGFTIEDQVFTGDSLMRGTVGGIRSSGHSTFAELRGSLIGQIMSLDEQTVVRPGHGEPTTVGHERVSNPFLLAWLAEQRPQERPITLSVVDENGLSVPKSATLIVEAHDYDGDKKLWVRWPDGRDDIVPGSWQLD